MWGVMGLVALLAVILFASTWADRRWPCDCGRSRRWYFMRSHERGGVMLARVLFQVAVLVWVVLDPDPLGVVAVPALLVWSWRRWWFHDKDRLQRKAARALGRVHLTRHGRLRVVPT